VGLRILTDMGELDDYLAGLDGSARAALERVRDVAIDVLPEVTQGRSYGMAALKYQDKPLLGLLAAKGHLSLFPFSPDVVAAVSDRLPVFDLSKGTIRFTAERPVPDDVLRDIVQRRAEEISGRSR
jgi:uncharacterized protein YdhG (YjbR/CyaY superfamily)